MLETKEAKLTELAIQKSLLLKEKCKRNPMFWLTNYCYTWDEHDKVTPIKPFPAKKSYIEPIVEAFYKEPILHIAKSRQMLISWLMMALMLHEAQFYDYSLEAVFSKKEEDAHALVERAKFIYNYQPKWLQSLCQLDRKMRDMPFGNLFWDNGSKLKGFAQGKDQIRSYVPTRALIDEAGFQEKLEETYGACVPCCKYIVTVSSANSGYFQRLVEL